MELIDASTSEWIAAIFSALVGAAIAEAVPTLRLRRQGAEEAKKFFADPGAWRASIGLAVAGTLVGVGHFASDLTHTPLAIAEAAAIGPALVEQLIDRTRKSPGRADVPVDPPVT